MIIDVTGTILIPGNNGKDCPGNGKTKDDNGEIIECCCDECDYFLCCFEEQGIDDCKNCLDPDCPHSLSVK